MALYELMIAIAAGELDRVGLAAKMREKGLITQTRDKEDRRRQFIEITDAGQKIIDDHAEQSAQIVAGFRSSLGDENYETLLDLLALLDPGSRD